MPYAPGEHEAIPDKPLYTVKIHLVLSTFEQRLGCYYCQNYVNVILFYV